MGHTKGRDFSFSFLSSSVSLGGEGIPTSRSMDD